MRVEQKQDVMFLWRNLRRLELVGCGGGPCVRERGWGAWDEKDEGWMNDRVDNGC